MLFLFTVTNNTRSLIFIVHSKNNVLPANKRKTGNNAFSDVLLILIRLEENVKLALIILMTTLKPPFLHSKQWVYSRISYRISL